MAIGPKNLRHARTQGVRLSSIPTLQMTSTAGSPDAWHHVGAPGGYEWWYFDAEDLSTGTRIVAIFLDGFVFHPEYLRRYFSYRRWPTRRQPPVAREYPCAYFAVYRGEKIVGQFMSQFPPGSLCASPDRPEVTIGPNVMKYDGAGNYQLHLEGVPWHLTWQGPKRPAGGKLSADFTFSSVLSHLPHERRFLSRAMTGAEHHWVIAAPLCEVAGTIRMTPNAGAVEELIPFGGRGYHDHNYGTGPLGPGLKRWMWGRILLTDGAYTFHVAEPRDSKLPMETHWIEADAAGIHERNDQVWTMQGSRRTATGLHFPEQLQYGDLLTLFEPKILDASPFYIRLVYSTRLAGKPSIPAFCEIATPHRLRWPVLGRMIEMSIHQEANL